MTSWYHLTDRARFKLDPSFMPADNAVAIEDRSGRAGIYLGSDVEKWVNGHGYWRPFVVEFDVDPSVAKDPGVHGRYSGEMFIPATSFDKLKIKRVIPLDAWAREQYGEPGWIESELGIEFDTGEPIPKRNDPAFKKYRGYHYNGPDVRSMPAAEVSRLKKDLRKVKRASVEPMDKLASQVALKFAALFNVGDIILYGKYKNKKGKIISFGKNDKGQPTVVIEPIPKGRKKNKEMGLYKIWTVPEKVKQALRVVARHH